MFFLLFRALRTGAVRITGKSAARENARTGPKGINVRHGVRKDPENPSRPKPSRIHRRDGPGHERDRNAERGKPQE